MKKGEIEHKRNHLINLIWYSLVTAVWCMDWLGYDYLKDWRNTISEWLQELKYKRYKWLQERD